MSDSLLGRDRIDVLVERLQAIPGWPADDEKDRRLMSSIINDYPNVDYEGSIAKMAAWLDDNEKRIHRGGKGVNYRARCRTWFANGRRFRQTVGSRKNTGSAGPRVGTAPAAAGSFGGSGYRSW